MRWLTLCAGLLLAAPATAQTAPAIDHAWARATPPMAQTAAAYLVIHGGDADEITGFRTPAASSATLHHTTMANGVMQMRSIASLPVSAGQDVVLAPGGMHVMLTGLTHPLAAGGHFPLTIVFAHAAPVTVDVTIERAGAAGPDGGMAMPSQTHP